MIEPINLNFRLLVTIKLNITMQWWQSDLFGHLVWNGPLIKHLEGLRSEGLQPEALEPHAYPSIVAFWLYGFVVLVHLFQYQVG